MSGNLQNDIYTKIIKLIDYILLETSYAEELIEIKNNIIMNMGKTKDEFMQELTQNAYIERIDEIAKALPINHTQISRFIENITTDINAISANDTYDYKRCDECDMLMVEEENMLNCMNESCNSTKLPLNMVKVVENNDAKYSNINQSVNNKQIVYDSRKHFIQWLYKIQGIENIDIPNEVINNIKAVINKTKLSYDKITCAEMRKILKNPALKYTRYNNSIPRIMAIITGISPPKLTEEQEHRILVLFNKINEEYVKLNISNNRPYYPYFIYKLIEFVCQDDPERLKLLNYIHLQSAATIIKNDNIFKKICENIPEILFKQTIL